MSKIVFATDAKPPTLAALPLVASLARRLGADVDLLHVPQSGTEPRGEAAAALDEAVGQLQRGGLDGRVVSKPAANAADAVREHAGEVSAELVAVVGRSGEKLLDRLLGSTTHDLIDDPPTDLLVVSRDHAPKHTAVRRCLVPVNFGDESIRCLELAARLTEPGGEVVLLFNVPANFPAFHGARGLESDYKNAEQLEANWRSDLEAFWDRYGSPDHRPVIVRSEGSWHQEAEVAAEKHGCDLVVAAEADGVVRRGLAEKLAAKLAVCPAVIARFDSGSVAHRETT